MHDPEVVNPYSNFLKTIEGTFDGENMWGEDNKIYPVPQNYASKSKLVEGDRLILYIQPNGKFIFKQKAPVNRRSLIGKVTFDDRVVCDGKTYRILHGSITYFKARMGDEAIIIVPLEGNPTWAALENIIKDKGFDQELDL